MDNRELIKMALENKKNAYVPYSGYHVSAVIETDDGKIYTGVNIEIASYSPTLCAERTAIFKAVSEGSTKVKKIVVVGDSDWTYPCGVCRQVIREFGKDAIIIIAKDEDNYREYTLDELLPHSFGPEELDNAKGDNI
ncbi:MAG: cytidine deaminase [Tissierellia bacterium]|nr:cytidine deaminase [Tissierellia bacterium]